jgi:hypothetical protein
MIPVTTLLNQANSGDRMDSDEDVTRDVSDVVIRTIVNPEHRPTVARVESIRTNYLSIITSSNWRSRLRTIAKNARDDVVRALTTEIVDEEKEEEVEEIGVSEEKEEPFTSSLIDEIRSTFTPEFLRDMENYLRSYASRNEMGGTGSTTTHVVAGMDSGSASRMAPRRVENFVPGGGSALESIVEGEDEDHSIDFSRNVSNAGAGAVAVAPVTASISISSSTEEVKVGDDIPSMYVMCRGCFVYSL